MCGIAGYISKRELDLDTALRAIQHRGPDGQGTHYCQLTDLHVGLGHVRLSIIDISAAANQPFYSPDDRYAIVFNGEIYNFKELRSQYLSDLNFQTSSDTEVLLHLYIRYGVESVNWLEGMFAFSILDKQTKELFVARDHLGIKPLYYAYSSSDFYFSSEIKGLTELGVKPIIDSNAIPEFLLSGFIYEPNTGFSNILKLPPGTYGVVKIAEKTISMQVTRYWTLAQEEGELPSAIDRSIHQHTLSDVPVGLFFSGGVDSSLLLSTLKNEVKSFTIRPSAADVAVAGNENDFEYAKKISEYLGIHDLKVINLTDEKLSNEQFLESVDSLSARNEELMSDYTYYASANLSKAARSHGIKVVLSGMGADEVFAGYNRYALLKNYRLLKALGTTRIFHFLSGFLKKIPYFSKKVKRFQSFFNAQKFIFSYSSVVGVFSKEDINNLLLNEYRKTSSFESKLQRLLTPYNKSSYLKKALVLDLHGFLSHNFMVADKSSMEASIEMRVPLATKRLYEISFGLPDSSLVKNGVTKVILKDLLCKVIPKEWVHRRKTGFNPPIDNYIRNLDKKSLFDFFDRRRLFEVCSYSAVEKIVDSHFDGKSNNTYQIFNLLYLASWYHRNSHHPVEGHRTAEAFTA